MTQKFAMIRMDPNPGIQFIQPPRLLGQLVDEIGMPFGDPFTVTLTVSDDEVVNDSFVSVVADRACAVDRLRVIMDGRVVVEMNLTTVTYVRKDDVLELSPGSLTIRLLGPDGSTTMAEMVSASRSAAAYVIDEEPTLYD